MALESDLPDSASQLAGIKGMYHHTWQVVFVLVFIFAFTTRKLKILFTCFLKIVQKQRRLCNGNLCVPQSLKYLPMSLYKKKFANLYWQLPGFEPWCFHLETV
jgi:hypothetical protein